MKLLAMMVSPDGYECAIAQTTGSRYVIVSTTIKRNGLRQISRITIEAGVARKLFTEALANMLPPEPPVDGPVDYEVV